MTITRYAVRRWDGELVDPRDIEEACRVSYLLDGNLPGVLTALVREAATNPVRFFRALSMLGGLSRSSDGLRAAAYLAEACVLKQRCKADGISHLHAHFGTNSAAVAMLSKVLGGPGYSFTAHGPDEFSIAQNQRYDMKLAHAEFAVAISHFARMQLIRWGGPQHRHKIRVARCGLELAEFTPSPVPRDANELVCVGRLCPQKGQTLIPEAIAPIVRDYPDLKVVLIGDGESRAEIEAEIARLGIADNIELTGWMANRDVIDRLKDARALLLPSFAEGLPIVIMEAMALGRPVISTFIAGIPELLDSRTGWIVPASSTEDLRAAITSVMDSSPNELTAKGREGRRRIEERHDVDALAATLDELFRDAAEGTATVTRDAAERAAFA